MNSEKIATLEDPIEIFQILQNMPRRLIDCHQFMNVSLNYHDSILYVSNRQTERVFGREFLF